MARNVIYYYIGFVLLVGVGFYFGVISEGNFIRESVDNYLEFIHNSDNVNLVSEMIKLLFLVGVFALVYSSMKAVSFTDSFVIRIAMSALLSFFGVMMITQDEVLNLIFAYRALGIALVFFFPILVLGFVSYVMATRFSIVGVITQGILWWAYALFLLVYTGGLLLSKYGFVSNTKIIQDTYDLLLSWVIPYSQAESSGVGLFAAWILFALALVVTWVFAIRNGKMIKMYKNMSEEERERWRETRRKYSEAKEEIDAREVIGA